MRAALAAVIVLIVLAAAAWPLAGRIRARRFSISHTQPMAAGLNGGYYRVHTEYAQPQRAADILAAAHAGCVRVMEHMRDKYLRHPGRRARFPSRAAATRMMLDNFDPDALAESSPHNYEGDTSYSIGKGRVFALCLRERDPRELGDPDTHDFHDMTTIMFVTMHEMAHLGVASFGHPPEFWSLFKLVLAESLEAGLVAGAWPDYGRYPVRYCGLTVDYNPANDPSVAIPV